MSSQINHKREIKCIVTADRSALERKATQAVKRACDSGREPRSIFFPGRADKSSSLPNTRRKLQTGHRCVTALCVQGLCFTDADGLRHVQNYMSNHRYISSKNVWQQNKTPQCCRKPWRKGSSTGFQALL